MPQSVKKSAEERMHKAIQSLQRDLASLRAGRATPALLDRVQVEYYGAMTPVNQLANVNTPDSRTLMIQPWDKSSLADIERAIQKSDLGLTPSNDGNTIRLSIPALTEERRTDLVKLTKKTAKKRRLPFVTFVAMRTMILKKWRKLIFPRMNPASIRKKSRKQPINLLPKWIKFWLQKKKKLWKYKRLVAPPLRWGLSLLSLRHIFRECWRNWNDQTGSVLVERGTKTANTGHFNRQYSAACCCHNGWERQMGQTDWDAEDCRASKWNEGSEAHSDCCG